MLFWLYADSPFLELFDISIDFGNCLLDCSLILHQNIENLSTDPLGDLTAITLDQINSFILHLEFGLDLLDQDFIKIFEFHSHILFLHEKQKRLKDSVNIDF